MNLEAAVAALGRGGLVAIVTDTVFGLACRLDQQDGIARLYAAKGRARDVPCQVLVHSVAALSEVAVLSAAVWRVVDELMPGALTAIVPSTGAVPDLGGRRGTVGVRIPDHPLARAVLRESGPLVASSANRAGEPTPSTIEGVRAVFGDEVDVYLDGPPPPSGHVSTVVDLTTTPPTLIRQGSVAWSQIVRSAGVG